MEVVVESRNFKSKKRKNVVNGDATEQSSQAAGDEIISSAKSVTSMVEKNTANDRLIKQLTSTLLISGMDDLRLGDGAAKKETKKCKADYRFWKTQPVPDLNEEITENDCIEADKAPDEVRKDPYTLPAGFAWCDVYLDDDAQLQELYDLLYENYVEDDDHLFRFDYSKSFLKWVLKSPGWHQDHLVGLRVTKSNKLIGFIAAVPCRLHIYDKVKVMVEVNFLCVYKKLRAKRMAPVLIREVTRRVHQHGLFQAMFTSGTLLPKPIATCRYWHRPLNPRKLVECGFSHLTHKMTMQRTIKLYRLPDAPSLKGFRRLAHKDVPQASLLLRKYLSKFPLHIMFSEEEFEHWFLNSEDVVNCFVVESDGGELTDLCSFYVLPSSVMRSQQHTTLRAAYSFYNASTVTPWSVLMQQLLIVAKQLNFDVFNALDVMDNTEFLEELKFGIGDGNLNYYLYNWRCPFTPSDQIAIVLQ